MIGQDIVDRLRKLMLDTGIEPRYDEQTLLEFLNDAPASILTLKPTALVEHRELTLVEGAKQDLPADVMFLHDVPANTANGMPSTAIRRTERDQLDQFRPGWYGMAPATKVKHFCHDEMDPKVIFVYPPNNGNGRVMAEITPLPEAIADLETELPFPDEYREAYLYYLAYRACDWDSDEPSNAERAQLFYQKYAGTLGVKIRTSGDTSPSRKEP